MIFKPFSVLLTRLFPDKFLRDNAIFFVATMIASFLHYLFHPIMARLLSVADYGEVQALFSIFGVVGIPLAIFATIVVNVVTNSDEHDHADWEERRLLLTRLRRIMEIVALALMVGLAVFSPWLKGFFHFSSAWPIVAVSATYIMAVPNSFRRAFLRGRRRFDLLGWGVIAESAGRLVFATLLVLIGWRTVGAMGGLVITQFVLFAFLYAWTKKGLRYIPGIAPSFGPDMRKEMKFALIILAVSFSTKVFSMYDVLVIKHYFTPDEAGLYGGISTVAKIVVFVTASIVAVLLPAVKLRNRPEENRKLLAKALGMTLLLGGGAALIFIVFPDFFIRLLIGERYLAYAGYLPRLSLLMLAGALIMPVFNYHLALRRRTVAFIGLGAIALTVSLSYLRHETIVQVINNFLAVAAATALAFAAWALIGKSNAYGKTQAADGSNTDK